MTKNIFITGTDTHIGKTVSCAILTLALKSIYWKPIQSGLLDSLADEVIVRELTGLSISHFLPSAYALQASLSPDQAAFLENRSIQLSVLMDCIHEYQHKNNNNNSLIIEGAGGVLVPLNHENLMIDFIHALDCPVIITARGTLGTINHTLLTIEALRQRDVTIAGIIFCGEVNPENQYAIEQHGKVRTLFSIPFFENLTPMHCQKWVKENHHRIITACQSFR